jgi:hypothetical protein
MLIQSSIDEFSVRNRVVFNTLDILARLYFIKMRRDLAMSATDKGGLHNTVWRSIKQGPMAVQSTRANRSLVGGSHDG